MSSIGTLSVDLELNGDGTFTTKITKIDGVMKQVKTTADSTTASINSLSSALSAIGSGSAGLNSAASAASKLKTEIEQAARSAQTSLSSLTTATERASGGMSNIGTSAASAARQASQAFNDAKAAANGFAASAAKSAASSPAPTTATAGSLSLPSLGGMPAQFLAITTAAKLASDAIAAIKEQVAAVIEAGDQYTQSVSRIQAALGSSREVATETYDALEKGAQRTGIDVGELVRSFSNFDIALSGIGQTRSQIVDFTTTLSTLAHISGTTSAAANRAFKELAEGMATGGVNLRQLKIVMQDMPPLGKALADSLHVTTGQLEEMAGAGKLTTDQVAHAVETMGSSVQKAFGEMPVSLQTARQNLTTGLNQLRTEIDQKFNLSQTLAKWDQFWGSIAQSAAQSMDGTATSKLERLKQTLAELNQQQAQGGTINISGPALNQRIAAVQKMIDALNQQVQAQENADQAQAASAKSQHEITEATDALSSAMKALGASGEGTDQIQKLSAAIAAGHDVTIPYDDGLVRASEVIDLLRQKATPAAQAIADLNKQLVEASARASGGFQAALTAARLKADPLDQSGKGSHLTDEQQAAIRSTLDGIGSAQGRSAVIQASRRFALASARQRPDNGLSAGLMQAQYDRDDFLKEHGTGTASTQEANQLFDTEKATAQIEAMQRGTSAAKSAQSAVEKLNEKIAQLQAGLHDGGTEVAKWTERLKSADPATKAQAASILAQAKQVDDLTAALQRARRASEALSALRGNLDQAMKDASDAAAEAQEGPQLAFTRQIDRMKRQQAELVAASRADTANPSRGIEAQNTAQQAEAQEGLALVRRQVTANQEAAAQVLKSWDDTETGRRKASLDTVQMEAQALQEAIGQYVTNEDEKKRLTAETASYIDAKTKEAMRQTEGATSHLGRQYGDVMDQMDDATASFASSFIDNMADQLATGTANWKSFGQSIIKELDEIALKMALSPLLKMMGGEFESGFGSSSAGSVGSIFSSIFGSSTDSDPFGGAGMDVGGFHTGGIIGAGEQTFTRQISSSLFANAPRYHTGGIVGDEIPAILKRGEGVFTEGQMAAIGNMHKRSMALGSAFDDVARNMQNVGASPASVTAQENNTSRTSAPKVTMNLHNQTGSEMKATSGTPKFDGESWVIDTVIKHAQKPGNLRNALKG